MASLYSVNAYGVQDAQHTEDLSSLLQQRARRWLLPQEFFDAASASSSSHSTAAWYIVRLLVVASDGSSWLLKEDSRREKAPRQQAAHRCVRCVVASVQSSSSCQRGRSRELVAVRKPLVIASSRACLAARRHVGLLIVASSCLSPSQKTARGRASVSRVSRKEPLVSRRPSCPSASRKLAVVSGDTLSSRNLARCQQTEGRQQTESRQALLGVERDLVVVSPRRRVTSSSREGRHRCSLSSQ